MFEIHFETMEAIKLVARRTLTAVMFKNFHG